MSYSLHARGANLAAALAAAAAKFDEVVASQPTHASDRQPALDCAAAFGALLKPDDTQDVVININGSLSWRHGEVGYSAASVSVSASLYPREA
jgi:5-enolpyruvylshikimate-3-phosphate synthase